MPAEKLNNIDPDSGQAIIAENDGKVIFGSNVKLRNLDTDSVKVFKIVGETEIDAREGKISFKSPLGKEVLGKYPGDDIEIITPTGEKYWEVLDVLYE